MANRNRIILSKKLFGQLIGRAEENGVIILNQEAGRWISRHSVSDAELMSRADCNLLFLHRRLKALVINYNEHQWFLTYGFQPSSTDFPGLAETEPTPSLFTLGVLEMSLSSEATGAQIRDVIEDQHDNVSGYQGHDIRSVIDLFPNLCYYKVLDYQVFSSNIFRLVGSYASRSYVHGPLMIDNTTCIRFADLFEGGNQFIPYDVVLQGLMSFSWKSLFIELYRCLEQLYAAPKMIELAQELSLSFSLQEMAEKLERLIAWRPREEEALANILRQCSKESVDSICMSLASHPSERLVASSEVAAKAVYSLRNNLVHFRTYSRNVNINDSKWNSVTLSMLDLIAEVYQIFGEKFHLSSTHS